MERRLAGGASGDDGNSADSATESTGDGGSLKVPGVTLGANAMVCGVDASIGVVQVSWTPSARQAELSHHFQQLLPFKNFTCAEGFFNLAAHWPKIVKTEDEAYPGFEGPDLGTSGRYHAQVGLTVILSPKVRRCMPPQPTVRR